MDPITAIANVVGKGLSFIPKPQGNANSTIYTNVQLERMRQNQELESQEKAAKQTATIVYSLLAITVIVIAVIIIRKRRRK